MHQPLLTLGTAMRRIARRLWAGLLAGVAVVPAVAAPAPGAELNVAQVVPLTGVQGGVGWQIQVGMQVAFDAANAAGGVQGRRINLVTLNEDGQVSLERLRGLLDKTGAVAVAGMLGGSTFEAMWQARLPQSMGVPVIGVQSGAPSVHQVVDPLMVVTRASAGEELDKVFQHLSTVHMHRVAYVGDDDDNGRQLLALAREKAARHGVELVSAALHLPDTAEVEPALQRILKTPHHAVVIASNTAAVALFSKLYRKSQGAGQIVALSSAEATQLALVVGDDAARGVMISQVVPNPRNPRVPLMREFLVDYGQHGPKDLEPTLTMTEAYINARMLVQVLQANGARADRSAVARYLAAHHSVELPGFRVVLRPQGGSRFTSMSVIDGRGHVLY